MPENLDADDFAMAAAARGDSDAFSGIVQRHQRRLIGFSRRMLADDCAAAEDIAQEALLRLWRQRARWTASGKCASWLLHCAYRLCLDRIDSAAAGELSLESASERAPEIVVAELASAADDVRAIRDAVGALPESQRAVIVLSVYEGRTLSEIAEILDIAPGTVASRKHHALRRLRAQLSPTSQKETAKETT